MADRYGLVRVRYAPGKLRHPEKWRDGEPPETLIMNCPLDGGDYGSYLGRIESLIESERPYLRREV